MKQLIAATRNKGKLSEIKALLEPLGIDVLSLDDIGFFDDIVEDGETFLDNAKKKAFVIAMRYHLPTLGDDSGLIVNALPNELGVHSKRFSKEATYPANNRLLLEKLTGIEDRSAHFITQLVLCYPDGTWREYEGRVDGEIAKDLKGKNGFGYDPLFIVEDNHRRMAELTEAEKNKISHRGRALAKLVEDIKDEIARL